MTFSQLEVASSFGCVLKDHNRRETCNRECNSTMASAATQAAFQKNLKELVRDNICISVSSSSSSQVGDGDENSPQNHRNMTTCITNCQQDGNKGKQQARILDRWAAKQAKEIVSTIQNDESLSSDNASNNSNLGASSLVQMWEARLRPAHIKVDRSNSNKNSPKSALASTTSTNKDNMEPKIDSSRLRFRSSSSNTSPSYAATNDDEITTSRTQDLADPNAMTASVSSSARTSGVNEDLFGGYDAAQSERSSYDGGESERVRIADIIKRLKSENTNENYEQGSSPSFCDPSPRRVGGAAAAGEPKSFSLVVNVNSLKIRGRQALNDLLVQMEQERQRELNSIVDRQSVSKFSHRGRIQSMLRVRSLERGMAIQNRNREQYQLAQSTTPSHSNRSYNGSTSISLRERLCRDIDEDGTSSSLTPKSGKEIASSIVNNEIRTTLHQVTKSNHCRDISVTNQRQATATTSKSCKEIMTENCMINVDKKNDHNKCISSTTNKEQASKSWKEIHNCVVNNKNSSTMMKTNSHRDFCGSEQQAESLSQTSVHDDDVHEESSARSDVTWQGTGSEVNNFEARAAFESTGSMDNWEGNEQDLEDSNYDWFSEIARPRSYWEDLRKGWYEHMLNCSSEDNEIKHLLQRKTVSSFLAGDFRLKIDRMIMSHVQIQAGKKDADLEEEGQERMGQLILSFLQTQSHSSSSDEERRRENLADADDEEEEDEDGQQVEEQESENPPSAFSSWNYSHNLQITDDSEQNPPSTEMELKVQMEQLQQEMYELRKAMEACLEMQSQMGTSVQREAARNSNDITRTERKCCICYDKQVDTFFYRCGHMCTCQRCAHELQWNSGKCPMCGAPILDVVRAYMQS